MYSTLREVTIIKKELLFVVLGFLLAVSLLLFKLFFFSEEKGDVEDVMLDETISITYSVNDDKEKLLVPILELFAFNTDSIKTKTNDESLLSALENLDVKIIAQANISNEQYTLLEVTSPTKSKSLLIKPVLGTATRVIVLVKVKQT